MNQKLPCVFVADDDDDGQYLLQVCFDRFSPHCRLHFSKNGQELLTNLADEPVNPALLLLDLNMPLLGGFETLERVRQNSRYATLPVIILTTSSAPVDRQKSFDLGATDFITKPIDQQAMEQIVRQLRLDWLDGQCWQK